MNLRRRLDAMNHHFERRSKSRREQHRPEDTLASLPLPRESSGAAHALNDRCLSSTPAARDPRRELAAFSGKRRTTGMREGNGRVLHRRSSESRWPRVMRWRPVRAQRSVDRGARRPVIEPRNWACPGCRRARKRRKATPLAALSRAVGGPRGVEEPVHACELSMLRTGRSHDHPPVGDGRAGRAGKAEAVIP